MYFLSLFMIFLSSYLILSVISQKTTKVFGLLYLLLIAFSQIILSFEILSLFSAISKDNFLICNFIFLLVSVFIFLNCGKKFYVPALKNEIRKLKFVLKRDKLFLACFIVFLVYLLIQIVVATLFPVRFLDALDYYFTRTIMWLQQGNLSHFWTSDSRELIMPINFDMLYMVHIMFTHSEKATGLVPFIGYIGTVYVIYNFVKELGGSIRQAFWAVIVFSSFAIITVMAVVPSCELTAGGLLLACVFLFLVYVKNNDKVALLFSALSFALSTGVKTTALMALPSIFILLFVILSIYKPENKFKKFFGFCFLFSVLFVVFSSYNYVLNYIQYSNFLSSEEHRLLNMFGGGIKSFICSLIKYVFMFFDASGINIPFYNEAMNFIQKKLLFILSLDDSNFPSSYFPKSFEFNERIDIVSCALGATGLFIFLPCFVKSFFVLKNKKERKLLFALALSLIFNVCAIASVMIFTQYNNKYIVTFALLTVPVLVYFVLFKNKLYKTFASFLVIFCLLIGTGDFYRVTVLKLKHLSYYDKFDEKILYEKMKNFEKGKVALLITQSRKDVFSLQKLYFDGFSIIKYLPEEVKSYDMSDVLYIITNKSEVSSSVIVKSGIGDDKTDNCAYLDKNKTVINDENKNRAVSIRCKIPFEYLYDKGFSSVLETEDYTVLKNKNIL